MNITINTLYDNSDYIFQHINNDNDKLLVYCLSPRCAIDAIYTKELDMYGKMVLSNNYDILFIRSKTQDHMNDADCDDAMFDVIKIAQQYNVVDGLFECGGSVLGLYFSKSIQYRNIYLDSARFLDGMTIESTNDFKFTKYKISNDSLNTNCQYFSFYNPYNEYDYKTNEWLNLQGISIKNIPYPQIASSELHPIKNVIGLKKYFKVFLRNVLTQNYKYD